MLRDYNTERIYLYSNSVQCFWNNPQYKLQSIHILLLKNQETKYQMDRDINKES
jgi:hypothetical protein